MPKMKTKKAIKKRFKATASGQLMRNRQGRRHILTKKSANRKRRLKKSSLTLAGYTKLYKRLACV